MSTAISIRKGKAHARAFNATDKNQVYGVGQSCGHAADGHPTGQQGPTVGDALLAYIKRRAQGGAGLIITEVTAVHPSGTASPKQPAAYDDRFIPGLKKLADCVHQVGGKVAMQLHHAGRESYYLLQKAEAIAPSAIPSPCFASRPGR